MRANAIWARNLKLLDWTSVDRWTLDQATLGVLITGATGSGKSTGPFQTIIQAFMRYGFAGIFLVAKPDAAAEYIRLARSENREKDVIVFQPDTPNQGFNFLTYEAQRCGTSKAIVENLVLLLMQAAEIASRKNGGSHDPFFDSAMKALLRHCLFVVITATDKVDLELVLQIVQTLPQNLNDIEEPERLRSMQLLAEAERRATTDRKHELEMARRYFLWEWPTLADRTRSSIAITLSVLLDAFLRYPLRDMFLSELTVSPDDVLAGKIVIVNVPVKTFDLIGKIAGVLWKYSLQRAIERRPELTNGNPIETIRPIFIAADECQFWTTSTDAYFQMTARSARGISVYSTQSIPNFYSEMGGDGTARARVDSLLANLQTRIACQNLDTTTNQWHSESIGKIIIKRHSHSITTNSSSNSGLLAQFAGAGKSENKSESEQLDYDVQPRAFTGLTRGGQENRGIVEAILVSAGQRFRFNRQRWIKVQFNQFKEPNPWLRLFSRQVVISIPKSKG
jgi:hypothetical protein